MDISQDLLCIDCGAKFRNGASQRCIDCQEKRRLLKIKKAKLKRGEKNENSIT